METIELGRTGLQVSRICMGTWTIGGWWWGEVDDQQSVAALNAARENGINFFDTADVYGGGRAEKLLGDTFGNNDQVVIASKGGVGFTEFGPSGTTNDPDYLCSACEASLQRLKRDAIDLYQVHWPDHKTALDDVVAVLQKLKDEGKIRHFGFSNFELEDLETALDLARFETVQCKFNLLHRDMLDEVIPFCEDNDLSFMGYSPLESGLLTGRFREEICFPEGDHRRQHPEFCGAQFKTNCQIIDLLQEYADRLECTLTQLAIGWVLGCSSNMIAICGARRDMQVDEICDTMEFALSSRELREITQIVRHVQTS